MIRWFIILQLVCIVQFFHKKCIRDFAMSPGVYGTAGKDGRIALFLAPFNIVIIRSHN